MDSRTGLALWPYRNDFARILNGGQHRDLTVTNASRATSGRGHVCNGVPAHTVPCHAPWCLPRDRASAVRSGGRQFAATKRRDASAFSRSFGSRSVGNPRAPLYMVLLTHMNSI